MADFDKLTEQYDLLFKDIERKNFINTHMFYFNYYENMVTIVTKMILLF